MKNILLVIIISVVSSSCSSYAFYIDSNPESADLKIINNTDTTYIGKTPIKVASKNIPEGNYIITLSKLGYEEEIVLKGNSKNLRMKKTDLGKRNLRIKE